MMGVGNVSILFLQKFMESACCNLNIKIIIIIIINIKDWTLWSVPSPEIQLFSPAFLRSANCSYFLWSVVIWFQRDSVCSEDTPPNSESPEEAQDWFTNIKIGYYFPILSLSFCKLCVWVFLGHKTRFTDFDLPFLDLKSKKSLRKRLWLLLKSFP